VSGLGGACAGLVGVAIPLSGLMSSSRRVMLGVFLRREGKS
jgi:hypothetical protein